jgi:hypothetical protein
MRDLVDSVCRDARRYLIVALVGCKTDLKSVVSENMILDFMAGRDDHVRCTYHFM